MVTLRPSNHPRFARPARNAVRRDFVSGSSSLYPIKMPIRRNRSCARTAIGHAATPPTTPRNSRRFMSTPRFGHWHRNASEEHPGRGRGMSALGQKPTLDKLFDDVVGALLELHRHVEAERLGGLHVDHQLEFDRRLDGKLARLLALQNLVHVS